MNRLDRLAYLNPRAVGAAKPVFDICARARLTRFKRFATKRRAVRRMEYVEPLARALWHVGCIDPDELRQRLGPTLE